MGIAVLFTSGVDMAQKGTTVGHTDFPLYTIHMVGDKHFLVAGGGGKAKTGISNSIELFELKNDSGQCIANSTNNFNTEDRATMNCDVCKIENTYVIAAGQDDGCQLYTLMTKVQALRPQTSEATGSTDPGVRKRKSNFTQSENYENAQKSIVYCLGKEQFYKTDFSTSGSFQNAVQFSPDHKLLVTAGTDGYVRVWQYPSMAKLHDIKAHENDIYDISIHPSGTSICSIAKDNKCFVWNIRDGQQKCEAEWKFNTKIKYRFRNCRFGKVVDRKDEYRLFTSHIPVVRSKNAFSYITKWNTDSYKPAKVRSTGDEILSAMAISDDGTYLGVGTISGSVSVYVSFSLVKLYQLSAAHKIFVTGLEFTPCTTSAVAVTGAYDFTLLSISADNQIKLHQAQPAPMYHVLWAIVGALIVLYLIFWFIAAFGL